MLLIQPQPQLGHLYILTVCYYYWFVHTAHKQASYKTRSHIERTRIDSTRERAKQSASTGRAHVPVRTVQRRCAA